MTILKKIDKLIAENFFSDIVKREGHVFKDGFLKGINPLKWGNFESGKKIVQQLKGSRRLRQLYSYAANELANKPVAAENARRRANMDLNELSRMIAGHAPSPRDLPPMHKFLASSIRKNNLGVAAGGATLGGVMALAGKEAYDQLQAPPDKVEQVVDIAKKAAIADIPIAGGYALYRVLQRKKKPYDTKKD